MRSRRRLRSISVLGGILVFALAASASASVLEDLDAAAPVPVGLAETLVDDAGDPNRLLGRICLGLSTAGVLVSIAELIVRSEAPVDLPVSNSGVASYSTDLMIYCARLKAGQVSEIPTPEVPAIDPASAAEPPPVPDPEATVNEQWPIINGLTQDPGGTSALLCMLVPLAAPVVLDEADAPALPVNTNRVTGPATPFCFTAASVLSDPGGPHYVIVPHPASVAPEAPPVSIPWPGPVVTPALPIDSPFPVTPPLPAAPDLPAVPVP